MAVTESEILQFTTGKPIYNFYGNSDNYSELKNFYSNFLNTNMDSEINKDYSFTVSRARITDATLEALRVNGDSKHREFVISDSAKNGAFIDILLPNVKNKRYREVGDKINGKEFAFLIPMGGENEGQFALATGIVKVNKKSIPSEKWMYSDLNTNFEIEKIEISNNIMVGPNAVSAKVNKNSQNIKVYSKNFETGMVELRDSNVEKIAQRIYSHNKSVFFAGHSNMDLINVAMRENIVNLSTMTLADLSNSTTMQSGVGALLGSYVNQHSNDFFMSGKELKTVLPEDSKVAQAIKDELIYRPEFSLEQEYLRKINVYNNSGEFNQELTDELANVMAENRYERKLSRNKFAELVGDSLTKQRQVLTAEQVVDYNKSLYAIAEERNSTISKQINAQMLQEAIKERREQFAHRIESKQKILDAENIEFKKMSSYKEYKEVHPKVSPEEFYNIRKSTIKRKLKLQLAIDINKTAQSLSDEDLLELEDGEFLEQFGNYEQLRTSFPKNKPDGNFGVNINMSLDEWNNNSIIANRQFLNRIGLLNTEETKSFYMLLPEEFQSKVDAKTLKAQQELKNRIVTDFKYNLLNDYGFVDRLTQEGETDVAKDMIVNRFYEYYNKLDTVNSDIAKVKDKLDNTIDEGALLGQIISGRIFDNYTVVGRQNDVKTGKARSVFATDFSLFGHMEQHNQRAGQSADKFSKAIINHKGESINISQMFGGFYSSIDEMKYKQQQIVYEQEKQLMRKLAPGINMTQEQIDAMPNLLQNQVKVLYAETEGAFLDSNLFTKSFALQNISMQDNKNPFVVHYSSLQGTNAFKKADGTFYSNDEIASFLKAAASKEELNDDQKIMREVVLTNLLGENNYKKYANFQNEDFKGDIEAIGDIIRRVRSIKESESAYGLSQEEVMKAFNSFTNKYFISSDDEARINLIQRDMLLSGAKTGVKGSNFGLIEDIEFTEEGIQLKVNQLLVETEGAKGMLNNSKHTARYTDLIKVVNKGESYYVEGLFNGLYNKKSRGNYGSFLSMSLTTMVSNALQVGLDGGGDIIKGPKGSISIDYEKRLNNFLDSMKGLNLSGSIKDGDGNLKSIDLLDLLNIDIKLSKSGQVIFTDKNAKIAIENFDPDSPVGLHSVIIENMNKNLAKKLGKKASSMTEEQAAAFGYYLMNRMYEKYEGEYTNTISAKDRKKLTIRMLDASIYNSFLTMDEETETLTSKMNLLDNTKGVSYLFNMFPSMMYEAKSRASEDALKVGRLSDITLEEAGFGEVVELLQDKATKHATGELQEYFGLAALKGSEFARGTNFFNKTFSKNTINLADEAQETYSVTDDIETYLAKSPLGKLISSSKVFDKEKKALKKGKNIKGLLTGFDSDLMARLRNFYNMDNESKVMYNIGTMASDSIIYSFTDFSKQNIMDKVFEGIDEKLIGKAFDRTKDGKEYKKELSRLIKEIGISGELDIRDAVRYIRNSNGNQVSTGLDTFINKILDSVTERIKLTDYDEIVKQKKLDGYESFLNKKAMLQFVENIKKFDYEDLDEKNANKALNLFKAFVGFAEGYKKAIGGMDSTLFYEIGQRTQDDIMNYNLSHDALKSIVFYNSTDTGEYSGIIASFFKDFGLVNRSNYLNIVDLQQVSQFENIPFIIDALSIDVGGRNVPTTMLSSLERIMKANYELIDLKKQQADLPNRFDSDLIRDLVRKVEGYKNKWYLSRNNDLLQEDQWRKEIVDVFNEEANKQSKLTEKYNDLLESIGRTWSSSTTKTAEQIEKERKKLEIAFKPIGKKIKEFNNIWNGATHFDYLVDENRFKDDDLFDVIKRGSSEVATHEIDEKFKVFKAKLKQFALTGEDADITDYVDLEDEDEIPYAVKTYVNRLKKNKNKINKKDLLNIFDNNLGLIETYDEIDSLISLNFGKNDDYVDVLKVLKEHLKRQGIATVRNTLKGHYQKIEEVVKVLESGKSVTGMRKINIPELQEKIERLKQDNFGQRLYTELIVGVQKRSDALMDELPEKILRKEQEFLSYILGRNNGLNKELFGPNGKFKDLATLILKDSASFSPVYAGGVEQAVVNEIEDIVNINKKEVNNVMKKADTLKNKLNAERKLRNAKSKKLYHYLHLLYGDELSAEIIEDMKIRFEKLSKGTNTFDDNYYEELKRKLSLFTNVIVGDSEMYRKLGMSKKFKNRQYSYEYLSRHPHQYRSSIAPTRYVMLSEKDKQSSFIRRIFGKGVGFGESSQNFLYFIGKRTSLAANGDFDGDTFQIMTLGHKNFQYGEFFKTLTPGKAKKLYQKKLKLYFLLNNVAGENLEENISSNSLKYVTIKNLIRDISYGGKNYDENGNLITDEMLYKKIELDYLGMTHEKIRVMNKVRKEVLDHSLIPNFTGDLEIKLDDGTKKQVSKLTAAMATLFTDGSIKTKLIDGTLTSEEYIKYINGLDILTETDKEEIAKIADPKMLKQIIKALGKDENIIHAQNLLHSDTKFLEMVGIANTGEVHDKLTKFRTTISSLINRGNLDVFLDIVEKKDIAYNTQYLTELLGGRNRKEFVSIYNEFAKAISSTNDIGTLIELASISSKKGRDDAAAGIIEAMRKIAETTKLREGKVHMNYQEVIDIIKKLQREGTNGNFKGEEIEYKNLGVNLNEFLSNLIEGYRSKIKRDNSPNMSDLQKAIRRLFILAADGDLKYVDDANATIGQVFAKDVDGKVKNITSHALAKAISTISYSISEGQLEYIAEKHDLALENLKKAFGYQNSFVGTVKELISQVTPDSVKNAVKKGYNEVQDFSANAKVLIRATTNSIKNAVEKNTAGRAKLAQEVEELSKESEAVINETNEAISKFSNAASEAASGAGEAAKEAPKAKTMEEVLEENGVMRKQAEKASETIRKLEQKLKELVDAGGSVNKDLMNQYKNRINELERTIVQLESVNENLKKASGAAQQAAETVAENADAAGKAVKKVAKYKKLGPYAIGAAAMAVFFSIFQRSRPVVNLDINEKQYEDSKGSVYRNLGQYTMNTNIRSLY